MIRVAHSNSVARQLLYLLFIAVVTVSLTNATNRRKSRQTQDPNPYTEGQWELSFTASAPMSHAAVLPNGKLLYWNGDAGPGTDSHTWNCVITNGRCETDVAGNYKQAIPYNPLELFCSGHSHLPDGRLFAAGGISPSAVGLSETTIFNLNPLPSDPSPASNGPTMTKGRWYPTTVTLGNGETAIVNGIYCPVPGPDCFTTYNTIPEVLNSAGTSLRTLSTAPEPANEMAVYPFLFLGTDGRVFRAGPLSPSRWLDTTGTGAWGTTTKPHFNGAAVPYRDFGAAVMYEPDKVLMAGGGQNPPTNTSEIISLTNEAGSWTPTSEPMEFARRHHNLTILANGQVLATGGTKGAGFNNTCTTEIVYHAELWDKGAPPNTPDSWTRMAPMSIRRHYHSVAVLLIDGRVLVGGTTFEPALPVKPPCTNIPSQLQQEIYSPPYLFNPDGSFATRPNISYAPETVSYGQQFLVGTPSGISINRVTLVRLSSVTHSVNMNQRFNELSFSHVGFGLRVNAPSNPNSTPPGHYMLFIINNAGVPSVAKVVQIQ